MPRFEGDEEVRALGRALAVLRRDRGISQAEAGRACGLTSQGWGLYEAGRRPGLCRPDVQRRLTGALDATPEAMALALARVAPVKPATGSASAAVRGVASASRPFDAGPGLDRLTLTDDRLAPWAGAGVTLVLDPSRSIRPGAGCVATLDDGRRLAGFLIAREADRVILDRGRDGSQGPTVLDAATVRSLTAVVARLEP